jgi:hypothetical protein
MSSPTNDNEDNTAVQDAAVVVVGSTTVDEDNSAGGGVGLLVPETKANDDDADIMVDETNKSSADDLGEKECHSIEIDLMQDTIREQLLKDQYREYCGAKTMNTRVLTVIRRIPWMMKQKSYSMLPNTPSLNLC